MPTLKVDLKKNPDGTWDAIKFTHQDARFVMTVLATSPYVLRLQFDAPEEVKIRSEREYQP